MKLLSMLSFILVFVLNQKNSNAQTCTLSCPSNIVIKADSSHEGAIVTYPAATSLGDCGVISLLPVLFSGSVHIASLPLLPAGKNVRLQLLLRMMNHQCYRR